MHRRALFAMLLAISLLASGCRGDNNPANTGITDTVTYLTSFGINGRESYAHIAAAKGYFAEVGIKVEIQAGQPGQFNEQAVVAGRAQFAAADASGVLARFGSAPLDQRHIRVVAATHQRTLVSLVSLGDTIQAPADLPGRTIGVGKGAAPVVLWPLYSRLANVPADSVTWQDQKPEALAGLLVADKIDAAGLFVAGVPQVEAAEARVAAQENRQPRPVRILPYSNFMNDLYGNLIITSATLADENPDLVRRFTTALMRGLEFAVENPDQAGELLKQQDPKQDAKTAAAELSYMAPYVQTGTGRVGAIDQTRMARAIALVQNLGTPTFAPDELVRFDLMPGSAR